MTLHFALYHLSLAIQDTPHIRQYPSRFDAILGAVPGEPIRFGAANHVLAGQAGDVRTRSADVFSFHHGGTMTGLRHGPRQMLPGLSTSDNKDVIAFYVGHDPPPCISNGSTPAIDGEFCPVDKTPTRFPSPANVHAATVDPVPPPRITTSYSSILSGACANDGFFVFVMRFFLSERQVRSWFALI
jgi:hypothetical protein